MKRKTYFILFVLSILFSCKTSKNTTSDANKALYLLDGIPVSKSQISHLEEKDLVEIVVLKGVSATSLYGKKAKHGAVLITTVGAAKRIYQSNFSSISKEYSTKLKSLGSDEDLLYIVDDKPLTEHIESVLYKVKMSQITEITLLSYSDTMAKFGIEKKQGAVIIRTR